MDFGFTHHSYDATVKNIYIISESSSIATSAAMPFIFHVYFAYFVQLGQKLIPWENGCLGKIITLRFSEKLLDVKENTSSTR